MIKINLATRKQPAAVEAKGTGMTRLNLNLGTISDFLKERSVQRFLLVLIVGAVAYGYNDYQKQELLDQQQTKLNELRATRTKLEQEASKMKALKEQQTELEAAQELIRTKLEIMTKLMSERGAAAKILRSLSNSLPAEIWLTDFRIKDNDVVIRGNASDIGQVPNVVKALQENAYFTDVALKSSQETKDESGARIATFEVGAKQRQ